MVTYGQIAQMLPPPEETDFETYQALSPRWVGSAMEVYSKDRTFGTPTTPIAHNLPPI